MTTPFKKNLGHYLTALTALIITVSIIKYPKEALEASIHGLRLWWDVVLPALVPFFAMSDILMGLGVVDFVGVLLQPIMRPLFNIPGVGGYCVAMGLASGYPIGAKITGNLRRQNLCNKAEGERLVSFANTADPLFMVGAVGVGMFANPLLGSVIALSHYISVVIVGFIMRFHAGSDRGEDTKETGYFNRALQELVKKRKKDGRPFGQIFYDAINDTFKSMLFIAGCIMMFSVVIRVLTISGVIGLINSLITQLFAFTGISPEIVNALVSGTFEIDIGCLAVAEAHAPLLHKAMAAGAIIAWSGLSVHFQVAAMLTGTDVSIAPYLRARLLHALIAAAITPLFMGPARGVTTVLTRALPVFANQAFYQPTFLSRLLTATQNSLTMIGLLLLIGLVVAIANRIVVFWVRLRD